MSSPSALIATNDRFVRTPAPQDAAVEPRHDGDGETDRLFVHVVQMRIATLWHDLRATNGRFFPRAAVSVGRRVSGGSKRSSWAARLRADGASRRGFLGGGEK